MIINFGHKSKTDYLPPVDLLALFLLLFPSLRELCPPFPPLLEGACCGLFCIRSWLSRGLKKYKKGLKLIKKVVKKNFDLSGEKRSTSYLLQSILITIQGGNATSVIGTVHNDRKLEKIYNLYSVVIKKFRLSNLD